MAYPDDLLAVEYADLHELSRFLMLVTLSGSTWILYNYFITIAGATRPIMNSCQKN